MTGGVALAASARLSRNTGWLGREDSNRRMAESKSDHFSN